MPTYLSPGVYVEEKKGAPPIVPVGTSTAAFLGQVPDDVTMPDLPQPDSRTTPPTTKYEVAKKLIPQLITNFDQFKTKFGDFQTANLNLAHGVYGFFLNGGSRCYVVRVPDLTVPNDIDTALTALGAIDEISMVAAPGDTDAGLQTKIIDHCKPPDHPYRIAILDGQQTPADPTSPAAIKGTISNSDYAALYFPWIQVTNPLFDRTNPNSPQNVSVAPSGHMAGVMARVDQQSGVFYAPANEIVRGALALDFYLGKREQDGLNPLGINLIRSFRGDLKVWVRGPSGETRTATPSTSTSAGP